MADSPVGRLPLLETSQTWPSCCWLTANSTEEIAGLSAV